MENDAISSEPGCSEERLARRPCWLVATARAAEQRGVSVFTLMDHWFQMDNFAAVSDPMLEGNTTLGFVAGHRRR